MWGAARFRGASRDPADEPPTKRAPKTERSRMAKRTAGGRRLVTGEPRSVEGRRARSADARGLPNQIGLEDAFRHPLEGPSARARAYCMPWTEASLSEASQEVEPTGI